jgi:ubiquinone/menaquinone biosynthesis C-methylase UbiE
MAISDTPARTVAFEQLRRMIQGQRLSRLARNPANVQFVQDACRQSGLGPGDRVIDVGCGPLGGLLTLAEVVGPGGSVVGLDHNADVLALAEQTVKRNGLSQVTLVHGDINEPSMAGLLGERSFDAAYCRLVLVNQRDPAATLRSMAQLVRPGGHVIAHELRFDTDYPVFDPPVPAFKRLLELMEECMRLQGKQVQVARQFESLCQEVGLQDIRQRDLFEGTPSSAPEFIQEQGVGLLMVFRRSFVALGLASADEVDELLRTLRSATEASYRAFASWTFVELIARVA